VTALDAPAPELPVAPVRARRLLPAAAVLGVVLFVLLGGYLIAAALSEPATAPVDVGGVVRVEPLSGWAVARGPSPTSARLTRGGGTLDVAAFAFRGDAGSLLEAYLTQVKPDAHQVSVGAVEPFRLRPGLPGARVYYVGTFGDVQTSTEGELTAVVLPSGVGVVFDGWAPEGLLRFVLDDIATMIDRAEVA